MTTTLDIGIPKKNIEGYTDPTCYKALKEIQRTEYGYRPLVYICSPYSGDVEANVELARRFSAFTVLARQIPLTPHFHYAQFMDDTDPDARELAMFFNRILLSKCEQLWAYIGRVSAGMRAEIDWAHQWTSPSASSTPTSRRCTPHDVVHLVRRQKLRQCEQQPLPEPPHHRPHRTRAGGGCGERCRAVGETATAGLRGDI